MPKITKPLTDTEIKNAKAKTKQYKLYDGSNLILVVFPNGKKKWQFHYKLHKRSSISLGSYPDVSLKEAREKRVIAQKKVDAGENPSLKHSSSLEHNFKKIADSFFAKQKSQSPSYIKGNQRKIERYIFPYFENRNINSIQPHEMLKVLQIIDNQGKNETAKRTFDLVSRIYRYACNSGIAKTNIMHSLDKKESFASVSSKNFAHTTDPKILRQVLLSIDDYFGDYNTKMALMVLPYLFVRPINIRLMKWEQIDFKQQIWSIPKEEMKTKRALDIPLTDTVIEIINSMKQISYNTSKYVFPSRISNMKILSENTLNQALSRLGYEYTAHGFRHTASTILHENIHNHKISSDAIEFQLAHSVGSSVKAIYNKATYIEERTILMKWWSDYLNKLKNSSLS